MEEIGQELEVTGVRIDQNTLYARIELANKKHDLKINFNCKMLRCKLST